MSTERDIEKILREAAKQRLEKAGPPLELHPANRRALQAEVAGQFGGKVGAARPFFLAWLGHAWPRVAVSFGLVLVLGLAATIWLRRDSQPRAKEQALAMTESRNSPGAVPGSFEGPTKDVKMELALAERKAADDRSTAVAENLRDQPPPLTTPAAAPVVAAAPPNPTPALAAAAPTTPTGDVRGERAASSLAPIAAPAAAPLVASAPTASTAPAATTAQDTLTFGAPKSAANSQVLMRSAQFETSAAKLSNGARGFAAGSTTLPQPASQPAAPQFPAVNQHFVQETELTITRSVAALAERPAVPILKVFDVMQNEGKLTITDADGSVYSGNLLPVEMQTDAVLERRAAKEEAARTTVNASSPVPQSVKKQTNLTADGAVAARVAGPTNWLFEVSGTNTSLNQQVVFKGSLFLTSTGHLISQFSNALKDKAAQNGFPAPAPAVSGTNFQIIGKAQLGRGTPIDVNARSVQQRQ